MSMTRTRLAAMGAVSAITVAAMAGALSPAAAQDADEGAGGTTRATIRAERHEALAAALAEELELPEERVAEALADVHEQLRAEAEARRLAGMRERLDAAVADGTLTRKQAEAILAAAESGVLPVRHGRSGPHARSRQFGDSSSE